jgi:hypothetical protein
VSRVRQWLADPKPAWASSLAILLASLTGFITWSQHLEPSGREAARIASLAELEPWVLRVAQTGLSSFAEASNAAGLSSSDGSVLAELFAVWMRLSLGRLHIFTLATCSRSPWLFAAALSPWLLFLALRPITGSFVPFLGAFVLAAGLVSVGPASITTPIGVNVACVLLVVAPYARTLGKGGVSPSEGTFGSSLLAAIGFALAFGAEPTLAWLAVICTVHVSLARWPSARRALRQGRILVPSFVLLAIPFVVLGFLASHGGLWGNRASASLNYVLAQRGSPARFEHWQGPAAGAPGWLSSAAALGLIGVSVRWARQQLTSAVRRERRDVSALAALAVIGVVFGAGMRLLLPDASATPPAELAWPFAAALSAVGLAALGESASGAWRSAAKPRAQSA